MVNNTKSVRFPVYTIKCTQKQHFVFRNKQSQKEKYWENSICTNNFLRRSVESGQYNIVVCWYCFTTGIRYLNFWQVFLHFFWHFKTCKIWAANKGKNASYTLPEIYVTLQCLMNSFKRNQVVNVIIFFNAREKKSWKIMIFFSCIKY